MKKIYALGLLTGSLLLANCGVELGYPGGTGSTSGGQVGEGKVIFVSQSTFKGGDIGSATSADAQCQRDNNRPSNSATYQALIFSTDRNATNWPLRSNTQYIRSDKVIIGKTGLNNKTFGFDLGASIGVTSGNVWTGVSSGYSAGQNCSNWTSSNNSSTGATGSASTKSEGAIGSSSYSNCDQQLPIYCVEI